ncbi:MAG: DUF885 family protein [Pseudomonadota bacterium]
MTFLRKALLTAALAAAYPAFAATAAQLAPALTAFKPSQQAMPAMISRYQLDAASLEHLYAVQNGARRSEQFKRFYQQWLAALDTLPFDSYGVEDRIDWVLLRNQIAFELREQADREQRLLEAEPLMPFLRPLVDLAEVRRLMQAQDGAASATLLQKSLGEVLAAQGKLLPGNAMGTATPLASRSTANRAVQTIASLRRDLKDWHGYYDGYDPAFSWWVKKPYAELDKALADYSAKLDEHLVGKSASSAARLNVTGDPIGRAGLVSALQREMIPYTPEELMALAEKELSWGESELRKAAREMGYGDDWHAAMEKVKTMYVPPGEQTAMVRGLAKEALDYVTSNKLVSVPEVARQGWRMDMLSPEQQLINPFFLGGDTILVSYPTDTMTHEQKLMSMRGNNPYFSRATVHHELIPGHHLQGFMAERYQPQRLLFNSPFYVEGWAVYWEMLLYERGYAAKPEERIGMMFWRNHRAARILFSLGFHLGKITPEQAVDMLVARVGHESDNARAEVRRSFNGDYPPLYQAGYMIGALQLRALKKELVDGAKMDLLHYHDAILEGGQMPAELIRARLKGEKIPRDFKPGWRFYQ